MDIEIEILGYWDIWIFEYSNIGMSNMGILIYGDNEILLYWGVEILGYGYMDSEIMGGLNIFKLG